MVWKVLFGLSGLIFLVVVGLAYLGLLPLSSFDLSGFDKIFRVSFLFLLSFLGYKATQKHRLKLFNYSLPTWPVVLTVLTTADEFIQILSPYRKFEILDILANLSGVYLGYYVIEHVKIDLGDPATLRTRAKSFVWSVLSCLNFPVFIMALLAFSRAIPLTFIPRYDFLFLACLIFEIFLLAIKREKPRDLITIVFFHILGLILENYKVNQGVGVIQNLLI